MARSILTILLTMLALLPIIETRASSAEMIGVAPSIVSMKISRQASRTFSIRVFNMGPTPMEVETAFQDFMLDPGGSVVFAKAGQKKQTWSASSWLKVRKKKFIVAPDSHKEIPIKISQPVQAEAGTHQALVTFSTLGPASRRSDGPQVRVKSSVSTIVLIDVAGDIVNDPTIVLKVPRFNLTSPKAYLSLGNRGNVHYFSQGRIEFADANGKIRKKSLLKAKSPGALVLPNAKRNFDLEWTDAPYFGAYSAKAIVTITGNHKLSAEKLFYIIRWQMLVATGLFFTFIMFSYYVLTRFQMVRKDRSDKD